MSSFIDATENHSHEEEFTDLFADKVEKDVRLSRGPKTWDSFYFFIDLPKKLLLHAIWG